MKATRHVEHEHIVTVDSISHSRSKNATVDKWLGDFHRKRKLRRELILVSCLVMNFD